MSNTVTELGKAFGGVIAVLALVVWLSISERERETELRMVYDEEPRALASSRFLAGERTFYECWRITRSSADKVVGDWVVPGEAQISTAVLIRFPERRRIERSWHIELSEDSARFSREAWRWAERYNLRLAELVATLDRDPAAEPGGRAR